MVVALPESPYALLALAIAVASVPYAYFGRYKASLVFGVAFLAVFLLQLAAFFSGPLDPAGNPCPEDLRAVCPVDAVELELAIQPALFLRGEEWWTPLTHMYAHSDFVHIFGNGLSLLFFGPKLESHIGTKRFSTLYLTAGLFAAVVSLVMFPTSDVRMLGASGAISGVLGLYVMRFPRDQVWMPIGFLPIAMPAWGFLIVFILLQFWMALTIIGVAWWAHLAGLAIGLGAGVWFRAQERRRTRGRYEPAADAGWTVEYYGR